jgi:hypothetical protein
MNRSGANSRNLCRFVLFALFGLFAAGCGGGSQLKEPAEASHLSKVGQLNEDYKQEHNGNYPSNLDELQQWAVQNGKAQDSDFKSTRDGQAYVLEPMGATKTKGGPVIIREATGKSGNKFVFASGRASEMSDSALEYMGGKTSGMIKGKSK